MLYSYPWTVSPASGEQGLWFTYYIPGTGSGTFQRAKAQCLLNMLSIHNELCAMQKDGVCGWIGGRVGGQVGEWMDGWMDGWVNGWMMSGQIGGWVVRLCQETDVQIRKLKESVLENYLQSNGQRLRAINKRWMQFQGKGEE